MIAVFLVGILAVIAVPNFSETTKRNRMAANANEVLSAFQYARTEALRRGGKIILAPKDGSNWESGLVVFADADSDNAYDANEELRFWDKLKSGSTLAAAAGSTRINFDSRGFAAGNGTGTPHGDAEENLILCDDRDDETGRAINILISGAAWIGEAEDDDC